MCGEKKYRKIFATKKKKNQGCNGSSGQKSLSFSEINKIKILLK